jgi:hypothetical protein
LFPNINIWEALLWLKKTQKFMIYLLLG